MMEKHANHLEQLVDERTTQLNEEKDRTDKLLNRLLPPQVEHFHCYLLLVLRIWLYICCAS